MNSPKSPTPSSSGISRFAHLEKIPDHNHMYKAVEKSTLSPITIKRTRCIAYSPRNVERARKIQPILQLLDHPHIAKSIDYLLERNDVYAILEFVPDSALASNVVRQRAITNFVNLPILDTNEIMVISSQLLSALKYLHEFPMGSIVFRDVSSDNILLSGCGDSMKCKLFDFTKAMMDDKLHGSIAASPSSSLSFSLVSSISTAAPEVVRIYSDLALPEDCIDSSSDIWSTGATLLELATSYKITDLPASSKKALHFGDNSWSFERDVLSSMSNEQQFLWLRQEEFVRLIITRCLRSKAASRPTASELQQLLTVLQSMPPKSPLSRTPTLQRKDSKRNKSPSPKKFSSKFSFSSKRLFHSPDSNSLEIANSVSPRLYRDQVQSKTPMSVTSTLADVSTSQQVQQCGELSMISTDLSASNSIVIQSPSSAPLSDSLEIPSFLNTSLTNDRSHIPYISQAAGSNLAKDERPIYNSLPLQRGFDLDSNTSRGSVIARPLQGPDNLTTESHIAPLPSNATSQFAITLNNVSSHNRDFSLGNPSREVEFAKIDSSLVDNDHQHNEKIDVFEYTEVNKSSLAIPIANDDSFSSMIEGHPIEDTSSSSTHWKTLAATFSSSGHQPYQHENMINNSSSSVQSMCWVSPSQLQSPHNDCCGESVNDRKCLYIAMNGKQANSIDIWKLCDVGYQELLFVRALTLEGHSDTVLSLTTLSADGALLSTSQDGTGRVWNIKYNGAHLAYECILCLDGHDSKSVNCSLQTQWYSRIVTGGANCSLSVWDIYAVKGTLGEGIANDHVNTLSKPDTITPLFTLIGHGDVVTACSIISDVRIVSASLDCTLRMWHLETRQCLHVFRGHMEGISSVISVCEGKFILSTGRDNTIRVWDIELKSGIQRVVHPHKSGVCSVSTLGDDESLSVVAADGQISLWTIHCSSYCQSLTSRNLSKKCCQLLDISPKFVSEMIQQSSNSSNASSRRIGILRHTGPLMMGDIGQRSNFIYIFCFN